MCRSKQQQKLKAVKGRKHVIKKKIKWKTIGFPPLGGKGWGNNYKKGQMGNWKWIIQFVEGKTHWMVSVVECTW